VTPARADRVVYYAAGGGHGHALRGLAVLRELGAGTLVAPARLAGWASALGVPHAPAEPHQLQRVRPLSEAALLLVDVFPRGVVGELAGVLAARVATGRPTWLVARRVTPAYYLDPGVRVAIERAYERIVWCEEPPSELRGLRVHRRHVPPVLLRVPRLPRDGARESLRVGADRRLIVAIGAGDPARQACLARLLGRIAGRADADVRFVSDDLPPTDVIVPCFPAAAWLAAAEVVVASGGYHAVHETLAAGVPTVYVPQRRRYDDQGWRVRHLPVAMDPPALERAVRALLARGRGVDAGDAGPSGAAALARLVERRVQRGVLREEEIAAMT
jgi:hypothetical protein